MAFRHQHSRWIVELDCNLTSGRPLKRGRGKRAKEETKEEKVADKKEKEEEKEEEKKGEERHPSLSLADHYQCYSQN